MSSLLRANAKLITRVHLALPNLSIPKGLIFLCSTSLSLLSLSPPYSLNIPSLLPPPSRALAQAEFWPLSFSRYMHGLHPHFLQQIFTPNFSMNLFLILSFKIISPLTLFHIPTLFYHCTYHYLVVNICRWCWWSEPACQCRRR